MIFLDFLLNLLLFKFEKRAICVKKALSFAYLSFILRLSFVTYSAVPARRLSFAYPSSHTRLCQLADFPSLNLRSTFAYPSLILRLSFAYLSLIYPLSIPYLSLIYPLSIAQGSVENNYEF